MGCKKSMTILLNKFGKVLTARDAGREAFSALSADLSQLAKSEPLVLDFTGVMTISPGWTDEFITPLYQEYGERLTARPTDNASVEVTLRVLKIPLLKQIPKS